MKKVKLEEPERLFKFLEGRDKGDEFKALVLKIFSKVGDIKKVSELTDVPVQTIYRWIEEWNKKKENGLENNKGKGGGRKPRLSNEQKQKLKEILKTKEFWTTKEVKALIKNEFGVEYSENKKNSKRS